LLHFEARNEDGLGIRIFKRRRFKLIHEREIKTDGSRSQIFFPSAFQCNKLLSSWKDNPLRSKVREYNVSRLRDFIDKSSWFWNSWNIIKGANRIYGGRVDLIYCTGSAPDKDSSTSMPWYLGNGLHFILDGQWVSSV
jgi:hypothetical protein